VWRGVLAWGQAKAGVQSSVKQWTENDRSKMKQVLNGVLEHVRLMEIGSEVFAQEVEPTGLLSMEMTLARSLQKSPFLYRLVQGDSSEISLKTNIHSTIFLHETKDLIQFPVYGYYGLMGQCNKFRAKRKHLILEIDQHTLKLHENCLMQKSCVGNRQTCHCLSHIPCSQSVDGTQFMSAHNW
jgi:hypothetical protein